MSEIGITTATEKIRKMTKRIRIVQGGTSASKTFSIVFYLIDLSLRDKKSKLTSIVSESFPHLRRGAMKDFLMIMKGLNLYKDVRWNKTGSTYEFETGSKIEFFSADQGDKLRGARRERLFLNEANNINYEAFEQLEVRTEEFIFIDFNPTAEFWSFTEIEGKRDDYEKIILTYHDNEALSAEIRKTIDARKHNKNWYKVYGLGQLGEIEELIYKGWRTIDEIPYEARLERRWLDFGYTNDPSAIGDIWYYNGGWILDEQLYRKGMSNKQLADFLNALEKPQITIVADSAEPKSMDELRSYGLNIVPSQKGKDSVASGIQLVQDQPLSVTRRSFNILKEQRNYMWLVDKNGKILNEEDPACANHHMCITADTVVDTIFGSKPVKELVGTTGYVFSRNGKIRRYFNVRKTKEDEIISLKFFNGAQLKCTLDHRILLDTGEWKRADCITSLDAVQLDTYGTSTHYFKNKARIFRVALLVGGQIFCKIWKTAAQSCLAIFPFSRLQSMWKKISDSAFGTYEILQSKLQNKNQTTTLIGTSREYRQEVFDLEVEGTQSFASNGIVIHNSGIRYALSTLGRLRQEENYWDRVWKEEMTDKPKNIFNKGR